MESARPPVISAEQLAKLYGVSFREAQIIRAVFGSSKTGFPIRGISRETGLSYDEVIEVMFSNSSCETIRIMRQFVVVD